jgi:hypothetical protein
MAPGRSMGEFEVDLDGEQVLFDGTWYSKDELARKIKTMVESGDYRVSRPSAALEHLQTALGSLRTVTVRLPADVAEALTEAAARAGLPVGTMLRDALTRLALPQGRPVAVPHAAHAPPSPPPAAMGESVTPAEAAAAVSLTPKRRAEEKEVTPVEHDTGWFTRR